MSSKKRSPQRHLAHFTPLRDALIAHLIHRMRNEIGNGFLNLVFGQILIVPMKTKLFQMRFYEFLMSFENLRVEIPVNSLASVRYQIVDQSSMAQGLQVNSGGNFLLNPYQFPLLLNASGVFLACTAGASKMNWTSPFSCFASFTNASAFANAG